MIFHHACKSLLLGGVALSRVGGKWGAWVLRAAATWALLLARYFAVCDGAVGENTIFLLAFILVLTLLGFFVKLLFELKVLYQALRWLGEAHEVVAAHEIVNVILWIIFTLIITGRQNVLLLRLSSILVEIGFLVVILRHRWFQVVVVLILLILVAVITLINIRGYLHLISIVAILGPVCEWVGLAEKPGVVT